MCWLLSGQRSLLCLGWYHLLQILPCWSLPQQEVTAYIHSLQYRSHFLFIANVCKSYHLFAPLIVDTPSGSISGSCTESHNAVKLVSQVIITDTERHASQMLCNANQYALDHPLPLSIFPALFSPRSRSLCLSFHPSLALSSHVQNYSLFASLSLFSRRFRRQDVRHGNAVQLCNGLQIDG